MPEENIKKDLFVEAVATAAKLWAERYWTGGTVEPVTLSPPEPDGDDEVLTRQEAARLLKVSPTQITRMRARGQLAAVKRLLPGKVRFLRSDLDKLLHKRR
jgi:excisionase family DNA binding protein